MKSGKFEDILDRVDCLSNGQVFLCCRTLVVLLDRQLAAQTTNLRPKNLVITDFDQFPRNGSREVQRWCQPLATARRPVLAEMGRFLMTMCLNRGTMQTMIAACGTAQAPVAHLGNLQPTQIVAALGVVMSWMPDCNALPLPQVEIFSRQDGTDGWPLRKAAPARQCRPVFQ